jgi:hypothetical protein
MLSEDRLLLREDMIYVQNPVATGLDAMVARECDRRRGSVDCHVPRQAMNAGNGAQLVTLLALVDLRKTECDIEVVEPLDMGKERFPTVDSRRVEPGAARPLRNRRVWSDGTPSQARAVRVIRRRSGPLGSGWGRGPGSGCECRSCDGLGRLGLLARGVTMPVLPFSVALDYDRCARDGQRGDGVANPKESPHPAAPRRHRALDSLEEEARQGRERWQLPERWRPSGRWIMVARRRDP